MTIPSKILVVNQFNTDGIAPAVGDLVVLDGNTGEVISAADAATANRIQFGVVKRAAVNTADPATTVPAYIVKTKAFRRDEIEKFSKMEHEASTEDSYEVDFTGLQAATAITPLSVVYLNMTYSLDARNVKREESYVLRISEFANDNAIATEFARLINRNKEGWATATAVGAVLTVNARVAVDHMPNATAINSPFPYTQTKMVLTSYHKDNESALSPYSTTGIAVDRLTAASPGINNPYVIRDLESNAAGYDSAHFFHVYPNQAPVSGLVITQDGQVDATVEYDAVSLAVDIRYKAADTNYTKSTTVYNTFYGDKQTFDADDVIAVLDGTYTP